MKTRLVVVAPGLVLAAMAAGWAGAQGLSKDSKSAFGLKGLTEVRELVVTYERGEDVTVKAHLRTPSNTPRRSRGCFRSRTLSRDRERGSP
jgi:hypothetical protein